MNNNPTGINQCTSGKSKLGSSSAKHTRISSKVKKFKGSGKPKTALQKWADKLK